MQEQLQAHVGNTRRTRYNNATPRMLHRQGRENDVPPRPTRDPCSPREPPTFGIRSLAAFSKVDRKPLPSTAVRPCCSHWVMPTATGAAWRRFLRTASIRYKDINIGAVNYRIQRIPPNAELPIGSTNCLNRTHVAVGVGSLLMHYLKQHAGHGICVLRLNLLNIPRAYRLITEAPAPRRQQ